jgi:hypothetical protein
MAVNVAEILRNKKGWCDIVLDSPFGKVVFDDIDDDNRLIVCHFINKKGDYIRVKFDFYGRYSGVVDECVLFPEGKKDWIEAAFSLFEEGELMFVETNNFEYVLKYAGIDEKGFVRIHAVWNKEFGFSSEDGILCSLDVVTAVRPASEAEAALLRYYMEEED